MGATERRILVVKLADLGDLLVCEPALRSLRAAYPDASIDVVVPPSSAALLPLLGHGLRAVTFPKQLFDRPRSLARPDRLMMGARFGLSLRRAGYDTVALLHHLTTNAGAVKFRWLTRATGAPEIVGLDNGRGTFLTTRVQDLGFGARHEVEYMLAIAKAAGGVDVDPAPRIDQSLLPHVPGLPRDYAVIYPATGPYSPARTWAAERYGAIAAAVAARGITPVIVGAKDALEPSAIIRRIAPDALDLVASTNLPGLAAVLKGSRVVIGADSFAGHLAAALDCPRVTVFGPSNRDAWRPWGSQDVVEASQVAATRGLVVYHDLPCQPCLYTGFRLGRPAGCPTRTCMALVTVEDVVRAIDLVIGGS